MNVAEFWEPLMAALSLAIGTVRLATAMATWLPWGQLALVTCSSVALGGALAVAWQKLRAQCRRTGDVGSYSEIVATHCQIAMSFQRDSAPNTLAPHQAACLAVLGAAVLQARNTLRSYPAPSSAHESGELMDAIHNLPAAVISNAFWDEGRVIRALNSYDKERQARAIASRQTSLPAFDLSVTYRRAFEAQRVFCERNRAIQQPQLEGGCP